MLDNLWLDLLTWWETVSPEFAFLLALPFVVAAIGLARDGWRRDDTAVNAAPEPNAAADRRSPGRDATPVTRSARGRAAETRARG